LISIKLSSRSASLFLLSIALLFGSLALPVVSAAQTTAANQSEAQPTSVSGGEHKPAKKSEAEEVQEYRHSATVKWVAGLLHVDVETAAKSFEYINFAVIVLAVGIPLFKMLPKVLRQRSVRLNAELEVAQAKTADANERLSAVEAKLSGLDAEISAIRKQVEEDMRKDEARHKALLEEETARVVASAQQEIAMAGTQAQRGLRQFAADLAIDRALSQLTIDADTDRALFAEFAQDIKPAHGKRAHVARGGQN
jgi:F-type H+-transporting ATPase subunit b